MSMILHRADIRYWFDINHRTNIVVYRTSSKISDRKQRVVLHRFCLFALQYQELLAQYEKKQKDLKNLCVEESQQKRALAMRLDKESKQNIRRQKKREMMEHHVQEVLGYLTILQ